MEGGPDDGSAAASAAVPDGAAAAPADAVAGEAVVAGMEAVAGILFGQLLASLDRASLASSRAGNACLMAAARAPLVEALADAAAAAPSGPAGERRRAAALRGLASVCGRAGRGDRRSAALAAECLGDAGAEVRRAAAAALAGAAVGLRDGRPEEAAGRLSLALADQDECVSAAAARALARLSVRGDAAVTAAALAHVRHRFPWARRAATSVLADVASKGNGPVLAVLTHAVAEDADWRVRVTAARALARVAERGDETVYAALRGRLQDSHPSVRQVAAGAIVHVAPLPSLPFLYGGNSAGAEPRPRRRLRGHATRTPSPPPSQRPRRAAARGGGAAARAKPATASGGA